MKGYKSMKKYAWLIPLMCVLILTISSCGNSNEHIGEAKTPSGSSVQQGRDYQYVEAEFEKRGFTNIRLVALDDLVSGWLSKEGEVESVSVDGDVDYGADVWYPEDVEIIITYHVIPVEDTEQTNGEESDSNSSEVKASTTEPVVEILTTENCEELASILSVKAEIDVSYSKFAAIYKGQIIEFDGCITYMINHADYDTRYDILISAGDYIDKNTSNPGPIFKFEDVGIYDLGLDGLYLPDFIAVGSNVVIQAKVKAFNENSGIFEIDPVSITER